jgi:hypothetical protein
MFVEVGPRLVSQSVSLHIHYVTNRSASPDIIAIAFIIVVIYLLLS